MNYIVSKDGVELGKLTGDLNVTADVVVPPVQPPVGVWTASYFSNELLNGTPKVVRQEPTAWFDWNGNSPAPGVPGNYFSLRLEREVDLPDGDRVYTVKVDDGVRMWIDGKLVLDRWIQQAPTTYQVRVPVTAGVHTQKIEYFQLEGAAVLQVMSDLAGPNPPPDPPPVPVGNLYPRLGPNVINYGRGVKETYDMGCRFFLAIGAAQMLSDFKALHPDAVVVHREYIANWTLSGKQLADRVGGGPNGVIYESFNEYDNWGGGTEKELSDRVNMEIQFVEAMLAKGAKVAFGGWPMGCPDITQEWVRVQLRRLASYYNNNPNVYVSQHLYSPTMNHIYNAADLVWFERRWEWLFTECGFDPKAGQKVIGTETGVDEGGVGGFPAHNANADDFAKWCSAWQEAQAKPLVVKGVQFPSPFLGAAIFGYTCGTDPRWLGYDWSQYMQAAKSQVRWS